MTQQPQTGGDCNRRRDNVGEGQNRKQVGGTGQRACRAEANLSVRRRANILVRTTWPVVKIGTDSTDVVVDAPNERVLRHM
jgi:hypothetical protein